jgi:hypothetical protein
MEELDRKIWQVDGKKGILRKFFAHFGEFA